MFDTLSEITESIPEDIEELVGFSNNKNLCKGTSKNIYVTSKHKSRYCQ